MASRLDSDAVIVASAMLAACPPNQVLSPTAGTAGHYWVVGTGPTALELLQLLVRLAHSRHAPSLTVLLAGPEAGQILAALLRQAPALRTVVHLEAVDLVTGPPTAGDQWDRLMALCDAVPALVYLCLEERGEAMVWRNALIKGFAREGWFPPLVCSMDTVPPPRRRAAGGTLRGLEPHLSFGADVDAMARALHAAGINVQPDVGTPRTSMPAKPDWDELSDDLKAFNKASAWHAWIKLRDVFADTCPLCNAPDSETWASPAQVEELARVEHRRWVAARAATGWRFGPVRDDAARLHPSMQPWEALSPAEQEKDFDAVRTVPSMLRTLGLGIVPRTPVLLRLRSAPRRAGRRLTGSRVVSLIQAARTRGRTLLPIVVLNDPDVVEAVMRLQGEQSTDLGVAYTNEATVGDLPAVWKDAGELNGPMPWCLVRAETLNADQLAHHFGWPLLDQTSDDPGT